VTSSEWEATVRWTAPSGRVAQAVAAALKPETGRELPRAETQISIHRRRVLDVRIRARDTSAARAALNTYLGWLGLVVATGRVARQGTSSARSP
jgi:tRNA threonylcarbamoyladenosine modification (KEOPS) complex  Pcc1 subunit